MALYWMMVQETGGGFLCRYGGFGTYCSTSSIVSALLKWSLIMVTWCPCWTDLLAHGAG